MVIGLRKMKENLSSRLAEARNKASAGSHARIFMTTLRLCY